MSKPSAPPDYCDPSVAQPSYPSVWGEEDATGLQAVDILPRMTSPDGPAGRPEYEPFDVVVARANTFLMQHPDYIVNTCESIEVRMANSKKNIPEIDNTSSVFTAWGERGALWIRGLRLWAQRSNSNQQSQLIGYRNFIPHVEHDKVRETFQDVVARINRSQIPGKIITVETQPVKWGTKGGINPDRTIWTEGGGTRPRFINLLRVFYVQGPPRHSPIGLADFVPKELPGEHQCPARRFETFPTVMDRVREWLLSVPPNYQPVNVQSILVRWVKAYKKRMDPRYIDTQEVMFYDLGDDVSYLRYLRVAYIVESLVEGPAARSTVLLGSKLFTPLMAKAPQSYSHKDNGEFESQDSIRARLDRWVQSTGARVVSVETVPMRIQRGGESVYGFDAMHTWNETYTSGSGSNRSTHRDNEKFGYFYRVYTDGIGNECNQEDNRLLEYTLSTCYKPSDDCSIL